MRVGAANRVDGSAGVRTLAAQGGMAPVPVFAEEPDLLCASETCLMHGGMRIDLHAQVVRHGADFAFVHEPAAVPRQGLLHDVAKRRHSCRLYGLIRAETGLTGLNKSGDGKKNPMHVPAQERGHGVHPVVQRAVIEGDDHGGAGLRPLPQNDAVQGSQADGLKAELFDEIEMAAKFFRSHAAVRPHLMVAQNRNACAQQLLGHGESSHALACLRNSA